jgi:hypothetical protein
VKQIFVITIVIVLFFSQKCNAQLSGIFTVGGTSPDFATIQDAAFALFGGTFLLLYLIALLKTFANSC